MVTRPWMPLYVADYLADTTHLSAAEHGAYLLLIMHYWQSGGLPKEDRKLARIARMSDREWKDARETVAEFFDGEWRHQRIDKELTESAEKYERRAMAGKKGGIAKAERVASDKLSNGIASSNASGNATPKQEALLYQPQPQSHSDNLPAQLSVPRGPAESDRPASERPPDPGARLTKSELDAVEAACRAALGEAQPQDLVIGPMVEIVRKFGQERVALYLASEARRPREKPIRTWKIWARIVAEALVDSLPRSSSDASAGPPERQFRIGYQDLEWSESFARSALSRWEESGIWFDAWGPIPPQSRRLREIAAELGIEITRLEKPNLPCRPPRRDDVEAEDDAA